MGTNYLDFEWSVPKNGTAVLNVPSGVQAAIETEVVAFGDILVRQWCMVHPFKNHPVQGHRVQHSSSRRLKDQRSAGSPREKKLSWD